LKKGLRWVADHPNDAPKTPLLMVYAWNEIDEGGAICPTKQDGARYLNALRAAAADFRSVRAESHRQHR